MTKIPTPKFEKADNNTIRIIVEKIQNVPLAQILANRENIIKQRDQMRKDVITQEKIAEQSLKNIDVILAEAKKLGIVVKKEPKKPEIRTLKEGTVSKGGRNNPPTSPRPEKSPKGQENNDSNLSKN